MILATMDDSVGLSRKPMRRQRGRSGAKFAVEMRLLGSAAALVATAGSSAFAQAQRTSPSPIDTAAVAEVRAASRSLDSALARADTASLRRFYADAYVHIDQYGTRTGRAERLAEFARGERRVQAMGPIIDETFAVTGDVVVASAQTSGRQTLNGVPAGTGPRMSTRVWRRGADGRWQVILAQVTPVTSR